MRLRILIFLAISFLMLSGCGGGQTPTTTALPPSATPEVTATTAALVSTATPEVTPPPKPTRELACGEVIQTALKTLGATCDALQRNQACYGHDRVQAEFQANITPKFDTTGDVVDLLAIKRLHTIPPDSSAKIWGVVVIKAQVNLPDSLPGQNVTFLLFGDTTMDGISGDMRAVTLSTGVGESQCKGAPPSSLLVQSPKGQEVTMNINGADISVGSTLYITAQQSAQMKIATIEGQASVTSDNVTQIVQPGAQVRLSLDANLKASSPPSAPEPFDTLAIQQAPLVMLERPVLVPQPIVPSPTPTTAPSPTPGGANFRADSSNLKSGDCTTVRWDVTGAKTIIFEGQPTRASSSRQVCPTQTTTYTLLVTRNDNSQEFYQVTITVQ